MKVSLKNQALPITSIVLLLILLIPSLHASGFANVWDKIKELDELAKLTSVLVGTMIMSAIIPFNIRDKLLFLRINDELPSRRVKKLALKDARMGELFIRRRYPELLDTDCPDKQHEIWWGAYQQSKNDKPVIVTHRAYLIFRDAFSSTLVMFFIALIERFIFVEVDIMPGNLSYYFVCTLILKIISTNYANRFTLNVLTSEKFTA